MSSDDTWDVGSVDLDGSVEWAELPEAGHAPAHRYRESSLLGRGGMGEVHLAEDPVLRRQVAIKRVKAAVPAFRRRLEREARITAALDHPNIVPVYDAGVDEQGNPWYAMRVIRGRTLRVAIEQAEGLAGRLRLVRSWLAACTAVAHAHSLGIVHRDLKPENILVGAFGETQVLDWGVARPVQSAAADWDPVLSQAAHTVAGAVVGSPAYMSPEAAAGEGIQFGSDVWSLGVCLYQLLTASLPFSAPSPHDVLARVLTETVPDPRSVVPEIPAELAAVVARACAREPGERYPDVAALIEDVEAWLDGRRVQAFAYTPTDELGRLVRRHRAVVRTLAVAGLVVLGIGVVAFWRTDQARQAAEIAGAQASAERVRAERHLAEALVGSGIVASTAGSRAEAETLASLALEIREDPRARGLMLDPRERPTRLLSVDLPDCVSVAVSVRGDVVVCNTGSELVGLDTQDGRELWRRTAEFSEFTLTADHLVGRAQTGLLVGAMHLRTGQTAELSVGGEAPVPDFNWSSRYLGLSGQGVMGLWDTEQEREISTHSIGGVLGVGVTQEGVLYATNGRELIRQAPGERGAVVPGALVPGEAAGALSSGALTEDGGTLLLGTLAGVVVRVDADGIRRRQVLDGAVRSMAVSPDGVGGAALDERGAAITWREGGELLRLPGRWRRARFREDGALVVVGEQVQVWSLPPAGVRHQLESVHGVSALDWGPGLLAAAYGDGMVRGFKLSGEETHSGMAGVLNVAKDVAVSPDGGILRGVGLEKAWIEVSGVDQAESLPLLSFCRRLVWLRSLTGCAGAEDGPMVLDDDFQLLRSLRRAGEVVVDMEPAGDRLRLVVATNAERVHVLDADGPPTIHRVVSRPGVRVVAMFSGADGDVVLGTPTTLERVDRAGEAVWSVPISSVPIDVAVSPDGRWMASGHLDGDVRVWAADTGQLRAVIPAHSERVSSVVFSPDTRYLASGGWDARIRIWDLGALDASAEALVAGVRNAWHLEMDEAVAHASGG